MSPWVLDKAALSLCAAGLCKLVLAEVVRDEVEEIILGRRSQDGPGCALPRPLSSFERRHLYSSERGVSSRAEVAFSDLKTTNIWRLVCVAPGMFGPG